MKKRFLSKYKSTVFCAGCLFVCLFFKTKKRKEKQLLPYSLSVFLFLFVFVFNIKIRWPEENFPFSLLGN